MLAHSRHRTRARNQVQVGVPTQDSIINAIRALCIKRYGDASPANLHKLFLDFDKNGDGCLNGNELNNLLNTVDQCVAILGCSPVSKQIISKLDKDGDRCITWEEYAEVAGVPKDDAGGLTGGASSGPIVKPSPVSAKPKYSEFTKGSSKATPVPAVPSKTVAPASTKSGGGGILLALGAVVGLVVLSR